MQAIRSFVEILRLDSAILGSLAVFVPYFSRSHDVTLSITQALPILFICMCTFVANDLDDIERDAINHPKRPLPSHHLRPATAAIIYFACIAAALYSTKHLIDEALSFWYFGLTVICVSYGYVVDFIPTFKTIYVGVCSAAPVVIVTRALPSASHLWLVAAAICLASIGREACMDIRDRAGDPASWMQRFSPQAVAVVAIALQASALLLLLMSIRRPIQAGALVVMAALLGTAGWLWFHARRVRLSIALMKLQFAVGLVFLW